MLTYTVQWTRRNGMAAAISCTTYMEALDKRDTLLRLNFPATIHLEEINRRDLGELKTACIVWQRAQQP